MRKYAIIGKQRGQIKFPFLASFMCCDKPYSESYNE